ncbi:type II toxin-antitoxin system MqsA family antitoxin [Legionella saoudiensis]|uniref:type II toxin-antitoxin system MqsA family antitoxin n=1 Tax=Legionella saoudiensis TaxID=1750561 RepID=UPI0007319BC0|nr:type II toxin-antitoxin system MqsA family antitoxin [Legionella saoudiensis]
MTKERCPICGELAAIHEGRKTTYHYKKHSFEIIQPALWCDSCGEGVISPEDNKATALEIQEHRSRIDGILTPGEITKIRKHLNLNQKDASRLFGGGINSFNRYERGTNPIPKPLSMLLVLLDKHPEQLNELLMSQVANPSEPCARAL